MTTATGNLEKKAFSSPDETRPFRGKGKVDIVMMGGGPVGMATFEPGWRWSENLKPIMNTDSCQVAHSCYFLEGRMRVRMDDGTETEFGPGDVMSCPPGHDAWIVGDETCKVVDWGGSTTYAKG